MQVISDEPDKIEMISHPKVFLVGQLSRVLQVSWRSQVKKGLGYPEDLVVIPQSPDTLLNVGLQDTAGIAIGVHPNLIEVLQPSSKGGFPLEKNLFFKTFCNGFSIYYYNYFFRLR